LLTNTYNVTGATVIYRWVQLILLKTKEKIIDSVEQMPSKRS